MYSRDLSSEPQALPPAHIKYLQLDAPQALKKYK